ncbi:MAG: GNAT family N-acetyltransferase [Ruminococcus sp.]|nr:GNAT family N-acetyltransferase [Ruminococcus sp.]
MNLSYKKINKDSPDISKIDKLNNEAFPDDERMETAIMLDFVEKNYMECIAFYDNEEFIGFVTIMTSTKLLYISFFAIVPEKRSKGYGSAILKKLNEIYSDKQIMLDLEYLDENAENSNQRIKRWKFYERNGFKYSGYHWSYFDLEFAIMCNQADFYVEDFTHMVEKHRDEKFQPKIFKVKYEINRSNYE